MLLAGCIAMVCFPAVAVAVADESAAAVLAEFDARGYASPRLAFERLRASPPPSAGAPQELRRRHLAALATHAIKLGEHAAADGAIGALQTLQRTETCVPCGVQLLLLRQQQAEERRDLPRVREGMAQLRSLPLP